MTEITEEKLSKEINKILENADLSKTTTKKVRQKLEKVFDTDLTDKKKLIDKLVMDYMNSKESDDEEDGDDDDDDDEEEEVKKPVKRPAPSKHSTEESEDDDSGSDYEAPKKKKQSKQAAKSTSKKTGGSGKKGTGYTRTYTLSPALAELMGQSEMPRHEVVKRVWAMVKEKNLYDPNNKQFAVCDKAMYKVFGVKRFRTFGMMKHLKNHFID